MVGRSRAPRLSWRPGAQTLALEGTRHEAPNGEGTDEHGVMLRGQLRW